MGPGEEDLTAEQLITLDYKCWHHCTQITDLKDYLAFLGQLFSNSNLMTRDDIFILNIARSCIFSISENVVNQLKC